MKKFIIAGLLVFITPLVLATVSSTTTQQSFTGLGSSTLSASLKFFANSELQVWIQDTATTPATLTQLAYGAGAGKFTITGGDPGTTVVLGTALTATQTAIIKRVLPLTQTTDYVDNGPFRAETHERALDRLTLIAQQISENTDKKIGLLPVSTASPVPTFPDPVANTFVQYNAAGTDLTLSPASPTSGDVLKFDGSAWAKYGLDAAMALKADASDLTSHTGNTSNPHSVTAAQVGAPTTGEFAAHVGNNLNPHIVTPLQVGSNTAQWNADKIVDKVVDSSAIADGRVLTYSAGSDTVVYAPAPLSPSLTDGHIFVGNASNNAVDVAVSGDATISNTGVVTVSNAATADAVSGVVDIANGGTGQSTAEAAFTALAPTAVAGQVAKWNGTEWIAAADDASGSSPVSFYFHNQASDIGGYETLLPYADGSTEVNEATVVSSATSPVLIDSYGSSTAIGGTQIDGGVWAFDFYARVDSATGTTRLQAKVFTRTTLGVETERFTVQTNDINNTGSTPMLYEVQSVQNSFAINATDRLVVKVYAVTDSVPARTLTFTYEGATYWSHFHTPLIRRHNDLAGLNEGDYKHLTATEYSGLDDATSIKGVTVDDAAKADGKALVYKSSSGNIEYSTVSSTSTGGGGPYNYVKAEDSTSGLTDWTETDADNDSDFGYSTLTTFQDHPSFTFDAAEAGDRICADVNAVDGSFNGEGSLWFYGDATSYYFALLDGSGNQLGSSVVLTNESDWRQARLNYPGTNGATIKPCIVATGNGAKIYATKIFYGEATNVGTVAQAESYGTIKYAQKASCTWSVNSATYSAMPADTDCNTPTVTGKVTAPATKIPAVTVSGPGVYKFTAKGGFHKSSTNNYVCVYKFSDGTLESTEMAHYAGGAYDTTPIVTGTVTVTDSASHTFNLYNKSNNGPGACDILADSSSAGSDFDFSIEVEKFPLANQTAVTVDTSGGSWSGYHKQENCSRTWSSAGYGDPTGDADCDLIEVANVNFGTVTSVSDGTGEQPGFTFTPKAAGKRYEVCANYSIEVSNSSTAASFRLTADGTMFAEAAPVRPYTLNSEHPATLCGITPVSTASSMTIKQQAAPSTGSVYLGTTPGASLASTFWTIKDISAQFPAPILQNQVSTTASGGIRTEYATFSCAASSSISSQSGWLSSIGNRSTNAYCILTPNAGVFSAAPSCVITRDTSGGTALSVVVNSATDIRPYIASAGDFNGHIICMGPR